MGDGSTRNILIVKKAVNIKDTICKIIADVAPDEDLSEIKSDIRLRDQLDLDSMDFLDIVMELRKQYQIEVPEDKYLKLESLDSCKEYLGPIFLEKGYEVISDNVWELR